MDKKNKVRNIQFLLFGIMTLWLSGCSSDDNDSTATMKIIALSLNGSPIVDGMEGVPLNSTVEIVFSAKVDPDSFESAFSLSSGEGEIPFSIDFMNQSTKVVLQFENMPAANLLTLVVGPAVSGLEGKRLENPIDLTFSTVNLDSDTKLPCLSGDCTQQLRFTDNFFEIHSNYDFVDDSEYVWDFIDKVVVVVHGAERNAGDYYNYMMNSLGSLGLEESTLVISPYFQDGPSATSDALVWNDSRWREGANAGNNNNAISSFTVMDSLVNLFSDPDRFPNLKTVFIAGHSSGAAFTQHYAIASKVQRLYPGLDFQYVVANNQYFYYPDGQRLDEETGNFYLPTDCAGFDYWPYGPEFRVPYLEEIEATTLAAQQRSSNTVYLLGSNDTVTSGTFNSSDCQAMLLGSNRFKRGGNMFTYMETFHAGNHNHRKIVVPNVGHDGNGMFNSNEFQQYLMEFQ